ncbi:MAG: glycosyltransferase [Deltaproteobacteria bacterium]|nr:MAG: glycosyltransferase [Deltaproteobacteria bacterium]
MPKLSDYKAVVGRDVVEELYILASHVGNRSIKMVNSTAVGGGVAEMLHRVVPLLNELGIATTWDVIKGGADFFDITKAFHNALQGKEGHFGEEVFKTYLAYNEMNYHELEFEEDLIVIHDPQPAAMIHWKKNRKNRWVWRCHIDMSHPNQQLWEFLRPYVEQYDGAIFSSPLFSPELNITQYRFYPSIDPLADKNRDLEAAYVEGVLEKYEIPTDKPIITQISRYDPWKDPVGVIEAFKMARKYVDCRLLMVGDKAADDPEAEEILAKVNDAAGDDPDIKIIFLLNSIPTEINAFQRASDVVLQKSLREGFALTVSEALWKHRPVIGGAVGGIPAQIIHGYTGMLVHSVEGASLQIRTLLKQPELAKRLGDNGHQRVKDEFLITKLLKRYLLLLVALDHPGQPTILME